VHRLLQEKFANFTFLLHFLGFALVSEFAKFEFLVQLAELDAFRMAMVVKVNPDSPQKQIRFLTLSG